MPGSPRLLAVALAAIIALTLITSGGTSDASEFTPGPPGATLSGDTSLGGNPDTVTAFDFGAPGANFPLEMGAINYTDSAFTIVGDASITNGRIAGKVDSTATLGILGGTCGPGTLSPSFVMFDADTSTTDAIDPAGPPSGAGRLSSMAEDNRGAASPEAIFRDNDSSGTRSAGDTKLLPSGASSLGNALIAFDANERHIDDTNFVAGVYDPDEIIIRDNNANNTWQSGTDTLLYGDTSVLSGGEALIAFTASEKHVDNGATANDYDGSAPNGLPDHLDATPSYNNTLFTPSAGGSALVPLARYSGNTNVGGLEVILQLVIFPPPGDSGPGDIALLPNGERRIASLGYPSVVLLQDPVGAPSKTISDFCTPLTTIITLCGKTDSNAANNSPTMSCDVDGASETRITSPGAARTVQTTLQAVSQRDADNDGIENGLDPCVLTDSSAWDPRASSDPGNSDSDSDGLPDDCDDGSSGTDQTDYDDDLWGNRIDNCPKVRNGDAIIATSEFAGVTTLEVNSTAGFAAGDRVKVSLEILGREETMTIDSLLSGPPRIVFESATTTLHGATDAISNEYITTNLGQADGDVAFPGNVRDRGTRTDGMGPECDTTTNGGTSGPDGHYHRTATITRWCHTATPGTHDVDGDGVCNTGAGLIDPADGDTDSDNDLVLDAEDNCISVANAAPTGLAQTDGDMDGLGDACDGSNDSDGDGASDALEIHVGTAPQDSACSATAGADNDFVDGRPTDLNDDGSITGADLSRVASVIGTTVDIGGPQANAGPVGRTRLRVDIAPAPNGSNTVTGADLSAVAGVIGTTC